MQRRGEVTVAGSATSGPSVITAPPPQPRLKDHPVKNGEKEWEKSEVREDQSQTGSSGLGVICVVIIPQQLWPPAQEQASQPSIAECEGDS